jgi:hypothetical protein
VGFKVKKGVKMDSKMYKVMFAAAAVLAVSILAAFAAADDVSDADGGTTGDLSWDYANHVLTISGNGQMGLYSYGWEGHSMNIWSVVIEQGATYIGPEAFYGYPELTSVTIPDSMIEIGHYAFQSCYNLINITFEGDEPTIIGLEAFSLGNFMTAATAYVWAGSDFVSSLPHNGYTTLNYGGLPGAGSYVPAAASGTIAGGLSWNLYDGVLTISGSGTMPDYDSTFNKAPWLDPTPKQHIQSVIIGPDVESIGAWAFANCQTIVSVTTYNGLRSIGDHAFDSCYVLTYISIPDSVTEIGDSAFSYCYALTSVTIPGGVTDIGAQAFSNCTALASVTISEGVRSIGDEAFDFCTSLTYISIPDSVTDIEDSAFAYCRALTSVTILGDVTEIGAYTFYGCYALESISIPSSVTKIGDNAFSACFALKSISIPNVTEIGNNAFFECSALTSVTIPLVTKIGADAFAYCYSLTSLTIPDSVTEIRARAFTGSSNLTNITFEGTAPALANIGSDAFSLGNYMSTATAYIWAADPTLAGSLPHTSYTTLNYGGLPGAGSYVPAAASGTIAGGLAWNLYDGVLTISGLGPMPDYDSTFNKAPWLDPTPDQHIRSVIIEGGVGSIGAYAFYRCFTLASVSISDSVTEIGVHAFEDCHALTSIIIPDSVTEIKSGAFYNCIALTSISIPGSVTEVGSEAFSNCSALSTVTISEGVIYIRDRAFYDCFALESISIPSSVIEIGREGFAYCTALTSVSISGVISIGSKAFDNCSALSSITAPAIASTALVGDSVLYYTPPQLIEIYHTGADSVTASQILDMVTLAVSASGPVGNVTVGLTPGASDIPVTGSWDQWSFDRGIYTRVFITVVPATLHDLVLTANGAGSIDYGYYDGSTHTGTVSAGTSETIQIAEGADVRLTAVNGAAVFLRWETDLTGTVNPNSLTMTGNKTVTAVFTSIPQVFTISASSDAGSVITPSGSQTVTAGGNMTFVFSAKAGYTVTDVLVDGISRFDLIGNGSYTFTNVTSGHTITVLSSDTPQITITVYVEGGDGYAEYRVGSAGYTRFTRTVNVSLGSDVRVQVVPSDGYEFVNWTGDLSGTDAELHISDLERSMTFTAHLKSTDTANDDGNNTLLIAAIIVAVIAALILLWFLLAYIRRGVKVIKVVAEDVEIIGKNRTRRNRPYRFSVNGDADVRYRTGKDGQWKTPVSEGSGKFIVPGDDVIDTLTVEVL